MTTALILCCSGNRRALVDEVILPSCRREGFDEILVVDDHSTDGTAAIAGDAGARVVSAADLLPGHGHGAQQGAYKQGAASLDVAPC